MLELAEFCAWITINGVTAQTYAVEQSWDGKSASGWIPSEAGMSFAVNWHNASRGCTIQSVATVDGVPCEPNIMLNASLAPSEDSTMTVSYTRSHNFATRDLVFRRTPISDFNGVVHSVDTPYNCGTITLELWAIQVTSIEYSYLANTSSQPVLTPEGNIDDHGPDQTIPGRRSIIQTPIRGNVNGYRLDDTPLCTFTFRYQPMNVLIANGIVPRPIRETRAVDVDVHQIDTEIRQLEDRIQVLRQVSTMPTSIPASSSWRPLSYLGSDVGEQSVQFEGKNSV